ncbi:MAG TPA: hypothetical protein VMW10_09505, partial [Alphaproteobacteria bacterium]|nr:hypothetical protein [Alphaproteobacteria bacterium]
TPTVDPWVMSTGTALGTTDNIRVQSTGEVTFPRTPAFFGYLAATVLNKSGTGTSYQLGADALTEVYDVNSDFTTAGVFTAPVDGKYSLTGSATIIDCTAATGMSISCVTSNRTYLRPFARAAGAQNLNNTVSINADMDSADTAVIQVLSTGEGGDTNDVFGAATNNNTSFGGFLLG